MKASKITSYHQQSLLKFLDVAKVAPVSEDLQVAPEETQPP